MANPVANSGTVTNLLITASGGADLGTNLSNYVRQITPQYTVNELNTTTMGNANESFIGGFQQQTYNVDGVWDTTLDGIIMPLLGGTASPIKYQPAGTASGLAYHSASVVWLEYSAPSNINDAVTWSGRFRVTGGVTRGTN